MVAQLPSRNSTLLAKRCTSRFDRFEITGAVVLVPHVLLYDERLPVVVVALLLFVLLDLEALHLFEFIGAHTILGQFVQTFLHEQEHRVTLFGGEGSIHLHRVSIAHAVVERDPRGSI